MIIMALDHVRHYFHRDAFSYEPTDLSQTNGLLFFTRFITHYCAPIFIFLAGVSAYLYGAKRTRRELTFYLFTRGVWLILAEVLIITLANTFNPSYPFINLQVIWAIGFSMIVLAAFVNLGMNWILGLALLLIAGHNLLDDFHVSGDGTFAFVWALLHDPKVFEFGRFKVSVTYPVLPWIGIIALGYFFGSFYHNHFDPPKRKKILLFTGIISVILFIVLRTINEYGDSAHWSLQKNFVFDILSFLNVTKYPPSLLYILATLGPAMIFLALTESPLNRQTKRIAIFGRVPFFYYMIHLYMIHFLAIIGAMILGYHWSVMILSDKVNHSPQLAGYGFDLNMVYLIWAILILYLYPACKWFDRYKREHQSSRWWLTYL
jgi:uncharacterized membrane protein